MNLKPSFLNIIIFIDIVIIYTLLTMFTTKPNDNFFWIKSICLSRYLMIVHCDYQVNYLPLFLLLPFYILSASLSNIFNKFKKFIILVSIIIIIFLIIIEEQILGARLIQRTCYSLTKGHELCRIF